MVLKKINEIKQQAVSSLTLLFKMILHWILHKWYKDDKFVKCFQHMVRSSAELQQCWRPDICLKLVWCVNKRRGVGKCISTNMNVCSNLFVDCFVVISSLIFNVLLFFISILFLKFQRNVGLLLFYFPTRFYP